MKLNVGCGWEARPSWINADRVALKGVDIVCDFDAPTWPFRDGSFDELDAVNVVEHLRDTVGVLEEFYRITRGGAVVRIRVPNWNSHIAWLDPTHLRPFHPNSFDFFDPSTFIGRRRPYYSRVRFRVQRRGYWIRAGWGHLEKYVLVWNPVARVVLDVLAYLFCNVIVLLEFELVTIKE